MKLPCKLQSTDFKFSCTQQFLKMFLENVDCQVPSSGILIQCLLYAEFFLSKIYWWKSCLIRLRLQIGYICKELIKNKFRSVEPQLNNTNILNYLVKIVRRGIDSRKKSIFRKGHARTQQEKWPYWKTGLEDLLETKPCCILDTELPSSRGLQI